MGSSRLEIRHRTKAAGLTGAYTVLAEAYDKTCLAQLSDPGSFGFNLPKKDPAWAGIDVGDYIQYVLNGNVVFTGVFDRDKVVLRDPENDAKQVADISGLSLVAEWADAIVYGHTPVGSDLEDDVRRFDWASPELDDSGWSSAVQLYQQDSPPGAAKEGKPLGFPTPSTQWIWSSNHAGDYLYSAGVSPFRYDFQINDDDTDVAIYIGVDDGFDLRLDGIPIGSNDKVNGWQTVYRVDVTLDAGMHTLAVLGENYDRLASTNTAGVIVDVWSLDSQGADGTRLFGSSNSWKTQHYPTTLPGFTVGKVLRLLLEEAQANGSLTGWTLDCSDTLDADGVSWPVDQTFTFDVGRDLLSVLEELADEHIDYVVDRQSKILHVYKYGTAGSSTSTADLIPYLLELKSEQRGQVKNSLLVKDANGFFTVTNPTSVAADGARWDHLVLGAVEDRDAATATAQSVVDLVAQRREKITAKLNERLLYVNNLEPIYGPWDVGDYVTVQNRSLVRTDYRVLGISIVEDSDANVVVVPTLNSKIDELATKLSRAVKRMERGTLDGRATVASAPRASEDARFRKVEIETITGSAPGSWANGVYLVSSRSSPYRPTQPGKFVWAEYDWDTAPATNVVLNIEIAGTVEDQHTLTAGEDNVNIYPALQVGRSQIVVVVADDDATAYGLTYKYHFMRFV